VWEQCDALANLPSSNCAVVAAALNDAAETIAGAHSELAESLGMGADGAAMQFGGASLHDDASDVAAAAADDDDDDDSDGDDDVWQLGPAERAAGLHALSVLRAAADCAAAASFGTRTLEEAFAAAAEGALVAEHSVVAALDAAAEAVAALSTAADELACACEPPQDPSTLQTHARGAVQAAEALAAAVQAAAAAAPGSDALGHALRGVAAMVAQMQQGAAALAVSGAPMA
jgi:hypothetical protein